MEKAVDELENSSKTLNKRLEKLLWKIEAFEKGPVQGKLGCDNKVSIIKVVQDIKNARASVSEMIQEADEIENTRKELAITVQETINHVSSGYGNLGNSE